MPDVVSIDSLNLLIFSMTIGISLAILGLMILHYRRNPYPTYIFLMLATFFYLISAVLTLIFMPEEEPTEPGQEPTIADILEIFEILLPASLILITGMGAVFFLVLFFQSFESNRILTERNLFVALFFAVLISGLLIITLQIGVALPGLRGKTEEEIVETNSIVFLAFLLVLFALSCAIFLLAMFIRIFVKLQRRIKATSNLEIQKKLKKMRYALIGMILGSSLSDPIQSSTDIVVGELFAVLAFGYFVYLYSTSGAAILQAESLQKLLIISREGMPLYSYSFQPDDSDSIPFNSQDVLFSGALRAISTLFSEFTGTMEQSLKEVTLENVVVMANQIADKRFLAVLLIDQTTRFFREAFEKATQQLDVVVSESNLHPNKTLSIPQIQSLDRVIESNFGGGQQRDYASLASSQG
ncbi:MAG: hypothetical protein ACE5OZ_15755 [Candidatus Heimdallarchaeota archaeon]